MNLYKLHSNPEILDGFDQRTDVPEILEDLAWTKQEPAIEQKIMKDPKLAYHYARRFFKGVGWPAAEKYIMKDPVAAYYYAKFVLEEPWPAAEKYIITDPLSASWYAIDVLKRRWPAAEDDIIEDGRWWNDYTDYFPEAKR